MHIKRCQFIFEIGSVVFSMHLDNINDERNSLNFIECKYRLHSTDV